MPPFSRLALTGLLLALPLSARADDKVEASQIRVAELAAQAAAKVRSGRVAEIYGERSRNDAGAGVDANSARGTRADAALPGRQLPSSLRATLPAPPEPDEGGAAPADSDSIVSRTIGAVRDWWSPPEAPLGKVVENPSFERAVCADGQQPPCPMEVMVMGENTPHAAKITDFVDYGEIKGDVFVQPKWWEFWKNAKPPSSDEVSQGGVGDCFLLASLAAIANKEPAILSKMIRQHKMTQAAWVSFYDGAPPKPVLVGPVDNLFPVFKQGTKQGDTDLGGQSAVAKPIGGPPPPRWPLIIEKAYAIKFRAGSYGNLNEGGLASDAMTHVTGRPSRWFVVQKDNHLYKAPVEFAALLEWDKKGLPIVIGTKSAPKDGCPAAAAAPAVSAPSDSVCTDPLYLGKVACPAGSADIVCKAGKSPTLAKSHAYWVKTIDPATQTVTLANPWGPEHPLIVWPWTRLQESLYVVYVNDK